MGWTSPMTFTASTPLTAAQLNTNIRDNFNYLRSNAAAWIGPSESRANVAYGDLATVGPAVTVTTDVQALLILTATIVDGTANGLAYMGCAISGATTRAPSDAQCVGMITYSVSVNSSMSFVGLATGLTPGSNTFTAKYRTSGGADTAFFVNRIVTVIPC